MTRAVGGASTRFPSAPAAGVPSAALPVLGVARAEEWLLCGVGVGWEVELKREESGQAATSWR